MPNNTNPVYPRIYTIIRQIPAGRVATYGQVASLVGDCTARMVGYALASLSLADARAGEISWQRVINAQGKISPRGGGDGARVQRELLEAEGVRFEGKEAGSERINLREFRWSGPSWTWLAEHGFDPARGEQAGQIDYWTDEAEIQQRAAESKP